MRILLCNKFYYRRGGDCIYTMNLEQMLKAHGHDVAIFSQQYPLNEPSPWSRYWPKEFKMKPNLNMLDSLLRPFGLGSIQRCFTKLLDDFRPDVIHLNNIHTQLSPILAELAHQRGIRVIWTIHDSKLVCPCYTCMRDGKWCEACFTDKKSVLRHNCMTGGKLGSFIGYKEAQNWTADRLQKSVDAFICPSQFMADTMHHGGYDKQKLLVRSNFIEAWKVSNPSFDKQDYYLFLGRISQIKGVRTLCQAASKLPMKLVMVGDGELLSELRETYKDNAQIEFRGQLGWDEIRPIVEKARFLVLPAEWSENNPLSIIESLSLGTPVLGANIGGIPELLDETNGMVFASGNQADLADKLQTMWSRSFNYQKIAADAIEHYADESYYQYLLSLYQQ